DRFLQILVRRDLLTKSDQEDASGHEERIGAIRRVYEEPAFALLRELLDAIYDYEEAFWDLRWQHLKVARRAIGQAPGTGGTKGINYLYERLSVVFFPELAEVHAGLVSAPSTLKFPVYEPP